MNILREWQLMAMRRPLDAPGRSLCRRSRHSSAESFGLSERNRGATDVTSKVTLDARWLAISLKRLHIATSSLHDAFHRLAFWSRLFVRLQPETRLDLLRGISS